MEIAEELGGCKTVGPGATVMGRYVIHLARAAQAVNPRELRLRKKTKESATDLFTKFCHLS